MSMDKPEFDSWLIKIKNHFGKSSLFAHLVLPTIFDSWRAYSTFRKYNYYDQPWNETVQKEYIAIHQLSYAQVINCFHPDIITILNNEMESIPIDQTIPYLLLFNYSLKINPSKFKGSPVL